MSRGDMACRLMARVAGTNGLRRDGQPGIRHLSLEAACVGPGGVRNGYGEVLVEAMLSCQMMTRLPYCRCRNPRVAINPEGGSRGSAYEVRPYRRRRGLCPGAQRGANPASTADAIGSIPANVVDRIPTTKQQQRRRNNSSTSR